MSFPPHAFIIGAQKAATTSLAFLLDQHPAIQLSSPKEPHFFSVNWERGEDWYREKFQDGSDDLLLLDASTSYAMAPISDAMPDSKKRPRWGQRVPERIQSFSKAAKFIYLLRRPADRTYSAYWHMVRSGRENLSFREAIAAHPVYLETSSYHAQLSVFLDHFDLNDFLLIDFRAFSQNPDRYANDCLTFLGVSDRGFQFHLESEKNKSFQYNKAGLTLKKLFGSEQKLKSANQFVKSVVPRSLHARMKSLVSKDIPKLTDDDRAYLEDYFIEDTEKLRSLTGFEFQ